MFRELHTFSNLQISLRLELEAAVFINILEAG